MKISSRDLIHATSLGGHCRFGFKADRAVRLCLLCDAEFEQTDEGFEALRAHEFLHGVGTLFNWSDLHDKTLRLVVVAYDTELKALYSCEADLYAVDDENGVVYHLNHEHGHSWAGEVEGWKWKIGKPTGLDDGLKLTPHAQALRLIGSGSTVEK